MTLLYPGAVPRLVPYDTGGPVASIGLILHVQAGDNSPFGWFANPANQAVSHWWVSKTGTVEQYVSADRKSWAQMAGNAAYHSVETEGFPTEALTSQQIGALAALYRWGHVTFGWPLVIADSPGVAGFGWHGMGDANWGNHPGCPGDLRKAQRAAILALAQPTHLEDDLMYLAQGPTAGIWIVQGGRARHIPAMADVQAYQAAGVPLIKLSDALINELAGA